MKKDRKYFLKLFAEHRRMQNEEKKNPVIDSISLVLNNLGYYATEKEYPTSRKEMEDFLEQGAKDLLVLVKKHRKISMKSYRRTWGYEVNRKELREMLIAFDYFDDSIPMYKALQDYLGGNQDISITCPEREKEILEEQKKQEEKLEQLFQKTATFISNPKITSKTAKLTLLNYYDSLGRVMSQARYKGIPAKMVITFYEKMLEELEVVERRKKK